MCSSGKLPVVYKKEDENEAEPLLVKLKQGRLTPQEPLKLIDLLYVTGQQLCDCDKLPEWKNYMNSYNVI